MYICMYIYATLLIALSCSLSPSSPMHQVSKECGDSYCTDAKLVASKHVKVRAY